MSFRPQATAKTAISRYLNSDVMGINPIKAVVNLANVAKIEAITQDSRIKAPTFRVFLRVRP